MADVLRRIAAPVTKQEAEAVGRHRGRIRARTATYAIVRGDDKLTRVLLPADLPPGAFDALRLFQRVEFESIETPRGLRAVAARLFSSESWIHGPRVGTHG